MASRVIPKRGRPRGPETILTPVKMTPELRRRFKVACAEEGMTYAQFITAALDRRDARIRQQRRAQAHPLHQPTRKSHYPGGGA